ncbi:MAG: response regulator [Butyrivibrio sp.]|nr:response regulator [Butyrivibrio sp.]
MQDDKSQISFHFMFMAVFTAFVALFDAVVILSGWAIHLMIMATVALVFCWFIHFVRIGNSSQRLYFYVAMILFVIGLYGTHGLTITDIPILLCLLEVFMSSQNDKKVIIVIGSSYVVYIIENILLTDYINADTEFTIFVRMFLGVASIIGAMIISFYFIDSRTELIKEIKVLKDDLVKSQKENEMFLSNMSHELRTPINAVVGVSELLTGEKLPANVKEKIELVLSAGKRLADQVGDVLGYSELQTGFLKVFNESYEPVSVINDAIAHTFGKYKTKKFEFAIDIESTLPRVLIGDSLALKKMLIALLDNAVKFTDEGGGILIVTYRQESYGINLNIDIHDTGCGMTPKQLSMLFNGVYLGNIDEERKKGGLGLGLAIVNGIAKRMNGFVKIDSKEGKGTHVHVSIPQKVASHEATFSISNVDDFVIVGYFNREKYSRSEVGGFYYELIEHVVSDFGFKITNATSMAELKEICKSKKYTHMFISSWEYFMDADYFEEMSKYMNVCIFAHYDFVPVVGSNVDVIYKPIFVISVINYLKSTRERVHNNDSIKSKDITSYSNRNYQGKRALVVDDDEMNLVVAKGILESMNIETTTAISGDVAIEKCTVADYDIIFMDYMMPIMNGVKAMNHIRDLRNGYYKERPIIVLTANAVSGAKEEFLKEGFDDFISKPIDIKEFAKLLNRYLR